MPLEVSRLGTLFAAAVVGSLATTHADATITNILSNDTSAPDESMPQVWTHQTSVSPLTTVGNEVSFTHHAQLLNAASFGGGVAQTHPRRSSFVLSFTVEDPTNAGFTLDIEQLLRGYSSVEVSSGQGDATGVSYFVQVDDSTDAPGTLSNDVSLFINTSGVTGTGTAGGPPTVVRALGESSSSETFGSFVGTTDFVFDYTTFFTPTTNVFFQNNSVGSGQINYGLAPTLPTDDYDPTELGHFFTVTATFVPEPASAALLGLGGLACLRRRQR